MEIKKPTNWWKDGVFHIEVPFGIINIRPQLKDMAGKPVDSIEIIPDRMAGRNAKALMPDGKEMRAGFSIRLVKDE